VDDRLPGANRSVFLQMIRRAEIPQSFPEHWQRAQNTKRNRGRNDRTNTRVN
jgi:hypothetical protein